VKPTFCAKTRSGQKPNSIPSASLASRMTLKPARSELECASLETFRSSPSVNPVARSSVSGGASGLVDQPALVDSDPVSNDVFPPAADLLVVAASSA
jgi:hypothetical protein